MTQNITYEFRCAACGTLHATFPQSAFCCLKRQNNGDRDKAATDTRCGRCGRFIPQHFGLDCPCKGRVEPKRAAYFREHYARNREKKIAAALARHYEQRLFA